MKQAFGMTTGGAARTEAAHYPALDGLRAFAIGGVLLLHYLSRAPMLPTPLGKLLFVSVGLGGYGVDLFFVLSGFLITGILLRSRESPSYFSTFYMRRVLRIFPLYYATLLLLSVVVPIVAPAAFGPLPTDQMSDGWFWTYLANWPIAVDGYGVSPHALPHFWTLAIEEQFYFLWPAVVYFAGPRRLARICGALIVLSMIVRAALVYRWTGIVEPQLTTVTRLDGLALGAVVAVWWSSPELVARCRSFVRPLLLVSTVAVAVLYAWRGSLRLDDHAVLIIGLPLIASALAALLASTLVSGPQAVLGRVLSLSPLRFVGRYSYAIYVLHYPILIALNTRGLSVKALLDRGWSPFAAEGTVVGVNLSVTMIASLTSWYLLESRFLRLKARFPYLMPTYRVGGTSHETPTSGRVSDGLIGD
jgi:peptidoglycan/LPS O-acetylase OafA/YrhL